MKKSSAGKPRSWMFVPGNRQKFLDKSWNAATDGLLLDLEDGVLPSDKDNGRRMIAAMLAGPRSAARQYVRVNALSTPWLKDDLDAVVCGGLEGICLTKVDTPSDIHTCNRMLEEFEAKRGLTLGTVKIIAAIESAVGLLNAYPIATASPRVSGLIFGAEDYALVLGLGARRQREAAELIYARSTIVVAAAAANVWSIDGVFPNLEDPDGLLADTWQARRLGFSSKSTFNPRQIDVINDVFSPQPEEIEYARKLVAAFREAEERGDASVAWGGQLVDKPILLRALSLLESLDDA